MFLNELANDQNEILNLQFQHKEYSSLLTALVFLVLLFISLLLWKKRTSKRIGDPKLVQALIIDYSPLKFTLKFTAFSGFHTWHFFRYESQKACDSVENNRKGIDIAIALDVSKVCWRHNLAPNRLERAKQLIVKPMNKMPDDRIALVLFAGKAYLQMPLTVDHGAAQLFVSSASPDAIPQQGTVISDALIMSTRVFNPTDRKFKAVVLISDQKIMMLMPFQLQKN